MTHGRRLGAAALLVASALTAPLLAADTAAKLDVTASCEHRATKGRVICDVEIEVPAGRIAWADVVVTAVPPFAAPLRSRVAIAEARTRTERRVRIPVAFVATALGRGAITVRGRAVVCTPTDRGESCTPKNAAATTDLLVGTDVQ